MDEIRKKESEEKQKIVADRIRAVRLAREANYHYKDIPKLLGKEDPAFVRHWVSSFLENKLDIWHYLLMTKFLRYILET